MTDETDSSRPMTFWDHLEELRWVIFRSLIALALCTTASFFFVGRIMELMLRPATHLGPGRVRLIYTAPMDAFMTQFKMALLLGCALALPFVLYFLSRFVAPALKPSERRIARVAIAGAVLFFVGGLAFGYGMLYLALPILVSFQLPGAEQYWSIKSYLDFCFQIMLGAGIAFELPVVLLVLVRLGLVKAALLAKVRPYAIIVIFVIAAVVTPTPDVFSQCMVGVPMVLLYEVSIWLARWQERKPPTLPAEE